MATSGSADFNNTRNDIINAALRKLGQLAEGETATSQQISDASGDLNRLVKGWQAIGLHLWKYEECVLFLELTKQSYDLGSTGDRFVKKSDLTITALGADAANGATSLTVDSISGISNGDQIGIVIDDNTIHWDTVNGAPSGTTVTITTGLDGAASEDNKIYVFTSKAVRPLQVTHGRTQIDSTNEIELTLLGREDYFRLSNKASDGVPIQIYYNPTLTNGKLYVWPTVADERQYLNLTTQMPIEDFDSEDDNPDLPAEWLQALVWNLASEIYTEYGVTDPVTIQKIEANAEKWLNQASEFDVEEADLVLMPDFWGYW